MDGASTSRAFLRSEGLPAKRAWRLSVAAALLGLFLLAPAAQAAQASGTIRGTGTGDLLVGSESSDSLMDVLQVGAFFAEWYASALSPDGQTIYLMDTGRLDLRVVDLAHLSDDSMVSLNLAMVPRGHGLAVSNDGSTLYVIDDAGVSVIITPELAPDYLPDYWSLGRGTIADLAISSDDSRLFIGFDDGTIAAYALPGGSLSAVLPIGSGASALSIVTSPDGSRVFAARSDGTVWSVSSDLSAATMLGSVGANPSSLAISPDGATLYIRSDTSGAVTRIDTRTGVAGPIFAGNPGLGDLALSPDGKWLYVAHGETSITVIDTATALEANTYATGGEDSALKLTISPNGKQLFANGGSSVTVINVVELNVSGTAEISAGTASTDFLLAVTAGNESLGSYPDRTISMEFLDSADVVVAGSLVTAELDAVTGLATIAMPTGALAEGTYAVRATWQRTLGSNIVAVAHGFRVVAGVAPDDDDDAGGSPPAQEGSTPPAGQVAADGGIQRLVATGSESLSHGLGALALLVVGLGLWGASRLLPGRLES